MSHPSTHRWLTVTLILVTVLTFGLIGLAWAGDYRASDEIVIGKDQVVTDDLYVGARRLVIDGIVKGDVLAGAQEVIVNGVVEGDLMAGAQFITVTGKIEHSIRAGGMSLVLGPTANVGRDVLFGGFSLVTLPGSKIGQDLAAGAYQTQLGGEVGRDILIGSSALELNGKVGRDVKAEVGAAADKADMTFMQYMMPLGTTILDPGLRVGAGASIGGKLTYTSREAGQIPSGVVPKGGIAYQTPTPEALPTAATTARAADPVGWIVGRVREFISLLLIGLLLLWLAPAVSQQAAAMVQSKPLPSLGLGCLTGIVVFVGVPIVVGLLVLVVIILGILTLGDLVGTVLSLGLTSLGLFLAAFLTVLNYVTKIVVALIVGQSLLGAIKPAWKEQRVWPLVLGLAILVLLMGVPILGGIIAFLVVFVGLGAIYLALRPVRKPAGA